MESDKIRSKYSSAEDLSQVKLEPDRFVDSMVDVSEQTDNKSELSQNFGMISEIVSGSLFQKLIV